MEAKEINITYETLFEILKREKDALNLQKLEPNFFNEFINYLNEKKKPLEKDSTLFSYDEKKKIEKQIDNAKRIIKEIYERREKKILEIALIKSRTKSNVMDKSAFLENEKLFFNDTVNVLNSFRSSIIEKVLMGLEPSEIGTKKDSEPKKIVEGKSGNNTKLVRFLYSVPKFVGKELEEYGPFEKEDAANLPLEIADLLIGKAKVEEIKDS